MTVAEDSPDFEAADGTTMGRRRGAAALVDLTVDLVLEGDVGAEDEVLLPLDEDFLARCRVKFLHQSGCSRTKLG